MRWFRAWVFLTALSFRRLLCSMSTLMVAFPLLLCVLFLWRRRYDAITPLPQAFRLFSQEFVIFILAAFVVPICTLAYATTSVGSDREDQTLLFLLLRPLPRGLILLAKVAATVPIAVGIVIGSFYLFCQLAGPAGALAFPTYWPPLLYTTLAYVGVFHLLSVGFRHATILALIYSLFVEFFLGNMPGIIKRLAINFYGRSMIFDLGAPHGLPAPDSEWFVPLATRPARQVLIAIAAGSLALAWIIFARREYRDLV